MIRTWFVANNEVLKAIAEMPDTTILSSIPKSDPKINEINNKIWDFKNTIAWETSINFITNKEQREVIFKNIKIIFHVVIYWFFKIYFYSR